MQVAPTFPLSLAVRNFFMRFRFISTPSTAFLVLNGGFWVRSRKGDGVKHSSGVVAVEISLVKMSARTSPQTSVRISVQSADVRGTLSEHHRYRSGYPCRCSTTLASTDIQAYVRADIRATFASTNIRADIGVVRIIRHGHP